MKLIMLITLMSLVGCLSGIPDKRSEGTVPVVLPFLRMDATECYFLDDFMPTPDRLVTGKSAGVFLRYYTFQLATYKNWHRDPVMLAFYSRDNRCWSLFEEYDLPKPTKLF